MKFCQNETEKQLRLKNTNCIRWRNYVQLVICEKVLTTEIPPILKSTENLFLNIKWKKL